MAHPAKSLRFLVIVLNAERAYLAYMQTLAEAQLECTTVANRYVNEPGNSVPAFGVVDDLEERTVVFRHNGERKRGGA